MTSISTTSLASLFLLNDNSNSAASQKKSAPSLANTLAALNSPSATNTGASADNSYLLDLSDSAKAFMQKSFLSGGASEAKGSNVSAVVLNYAQQTTLDTILKKYKDAPYNDATFQKIQVDMDTAGIAADTLAAQSQMRNLNPTLMLLNALSGGDGSVGTVGSSGDIKTATNDFMRSVAQQWKNISSKAEDSAASAPVGA